MPSKLAISAPTDGSKSIAQTSPLMGTGIGALAIQVVVAVSLEGGQVAVVAVILLRPDRRRFEDRGSLFGGNFRSSLAFQRLPVWVIVWGVIASPSDPVFEITRSVRPG